MHDFLQEVADRIAVIPTNEDLCDSAAAFMRASAQPKYSYHVSGGPPARGHSWLQHAGRCRAFIARAECRATVSLFLPHQPPC